ncbi:hypothetical protein ACIBF1_20565 [Spirillospora sp. NPDC050679]
MGRIKKTRVSRNTGWDFRLAPDTIPSFEIAIEVCGVGIRCTDDHLGEACGAFPPGCCWWPWPSKTVADGKPRSGDRTN